MKIDNIILNAYKNVGMYIDMAENEGINIEEIIDNKDYKKLPVIKKNTVINHNSVISSAHIMSYYQGKLLRTITSGSTGKYLDIYWDMKNYNKSMLPLWLLRKKYYGIGTRDTMCNFYSMGHLVNSGDMMEGENYVSFSKMNLTIEKLKDIYEKMLEVQPKWLMLQPGMAMLICKCIDKYNLPKLESVKYIEMTGEMLTKEVRDEVEKHFDCKIANQYGAYEFNSIAYECPCGNLHIMDTNVMVEIIDENNEVVEDGKEGNVCVTTLTNEAMPLIRYVIGDYGRIKNETCPCGSNRPILELTSGRSTSWIDGVNGEKISAYELISAVDNLNYAIDATIKQFCIEQVGLEDFVIKLVLSDDLSEHEIMEIPNTFKGMINNDKLKNANYEFEYHDMFFPDSRTGKVSCFVNKIGK